MILTALVGIGIMVSGSVGGGSLGGDLAGLGAAAGLGGSFVVIARYPNRTMVPAIGVGGLIAAVLVALWATPLSPTASDFGYLAISGFIVLPLGFGLLAVAPRSIPGAEVALITLLEAVLGPLWVWIALGEAPVPAAIVGGVIVIGALAFNSLAMLRGPDSIVRVAAVA